VTTLAPITPSGRSYHGPPLAVIADAKAGGADISPTDRNWGRPVKFRPRISNSGRWGTRKHPGRRPPGAHQRASDPPPAAGTRNGRRGRQHRNHEASRPNLTLSVIPTWVPANLITWRLFGIPGLRSRGSDPEHFKRNPRKIVLGEDRQCLPSFPGRRLESRARLRHPGRNSTRENWKVRICDQSSGTPTADLSAKVEGVDERDCQAHLPLRKNLHANNFGNLRLQPP